MQTLEINHNDFTQGRESEADAHLLVRFFMREKQDMTASQEEGRPIYKDREYIEIRAAGKRDALACRPATHADKQRFPRHYDAFTRRVEMPTEGTPLSEWPQMTRSLAEELSFLKVKTVENLANMADNDAGQIRGGLDWKRKAVEFLKYSDKTKVIAEKNQLEERLAKQDAEMAELKAQIAAMMPKPQAESAPKDIDTEAAAPKPRRRRNTTEE